MFFNCFRLIMVYLKYINKKCNWNILEKILGFFIEINVKNMRC